MNETEQKFNEPGTLNALGNGWRSIKGNFLVFFLSVLVEGIIHAPLDNENMWDSSPTAGIIILAWGLLVYSVFNFGADLVFLRGVRDGEVKINLIISGFREGVDKYTNIILAALLLVGLIGISLLLLVAPGIYVACRLAFVSYLVMDEGLDPVEAVEASWRITEGHVLKILGLGMLAIPIVIGGLLLLIVGIFPAVMWLKASFASLYLSITQSAESGTLSDAA